MAIALPQYDRIRRLRRKYGVDFPDLNEKDANQLALSFKKWLESQRQGQEHVMRDRRLHWSRHRNFRVGNQHISSRDGRTWREPSADKNSMRATLNIIGPSLDFRHGVIAEQRPGFRHETQKATIEARERAEAQQAVAEHYFHRLSAWRTMRDAIYNAQTDGVSFVQVYVDKLAGKRIQNAHQLTPDDPRFMGYLAQGYKPSPEGVLLIPLSDSGSVLPPDAPITELPEGDLACRLVLAHDTFVDPEARQLNGEGETAKWFAIRRPRELYSARIETGNDELQSETLDTLLDPSDYPMESVQGWQRGLPPFPAGNRTRFKESVYDWTLYIAPDGEDIPEGMWRRLIGDVIVDGADELPGGVYPFARFTDGSPDPSFYPRPLMADWIADQVSINTLHTMQLTQARVSGMGRLLAMKGTLLSETYSAIAGSVVEYEGMKPERLEAQRTSSEVSEQLAMLIRKLEDKTGWNDLARGQVLGSAGGGMQDVSGRAVLGAQEALMRTFGPMVQGAAEGASEWAEVVVKLAAWLFGDTPRMIPTVGGRGDLAKLVSREQLEGDVSVYVDPATLMPMPAQLRQQMLLDLLQRGWITLAEFQKRAPHAEIRNVYMGDIDHFQNAQWTNTLMEEGFEKYAAMPPLELYSEVGLPILWQDDPLVHLQALNELVLNPRKPWPLRKLAMDRAGIYEQLGQAKMDPMQPVPAEVLGVPMNRMIAQLMPPPPMPAAPNAAPPSGGDATAPGNSATASVAPAPGLSAAGAPAEMGQQAAPLTAAEGASPDMTQR